MALKNIQSSSSDVAQALARGDTLKATEPFTKAGLEVDLPCRGIVTISAANTIEKPLRLMISAGIHGDETAPIEMLAQLLLELGQNPRQLTVDVMIVIGNLPAIAQGRRFVEMDMNRLFVSDSSKSQATVDAQRAAEIMHATDLFFSGREERKWHLDLHTTIRPSLYPSFAVIPDVFAQLAGAGIEAAILNNKPAGTFSAYTAVQYGAVSCTVELGRVGKFGENDLSTLTSPCNALHALLRGQSHGSWQSMPQVFTVVQELIKFSDQFTLELDGSVKNFTPVKKGKILAQDGAHLYQVKHDTEYIVFPNPDVHIGQRAGLMVARTDTLF
jgi:succinylglutamate desuccinylase